MASRQQLQAMRQIVSLAEDPAEAAKRFRELVHAAIEQFNEGHLGRAATMFELAEQLVAEKKVQAGVRRARCASRDTSSWTRSGCGSPPSAPTCARSCASS